MFKRIEKLINRINEFNESLIKTYSNRIGKDRFSNFQVRLWIMSMVCLFVIYLFLNNKFDFNILFTYLLSLIIVLILNWVVGLIYIHIVNRALFIRYIETI